MLDRKMTLLLVLGGLLLPPAAFGQVVEEDRGEVISNPTYRSGKEERPALDRVAKQIVEKTNAFRREEGRTKVEVNASLEKAARYFADYLARENKFSHTADGSRPADRAKKFGYDYCIVLENIAYEYSPAGFASDRLATAFVEGWKNSPGHRRNMLDPDVTETGVAVARSDKTGYYYAVQMFGRPRSAAVRFDVANQADAEVKYKVGGQSFSLPPGYTRTHQLCRPADLTVELPASEGEKGGSKKVRPAAGDHYVITGEKGAYRVRKGEG
jgi:uncharacterized protein YkwD